MKRPLLMLLGFIAGIGSVLTITPPNFNSTALPSLPLGNGGTLPPVKPVSNAPVSNAPVSNAPVSNAPVSNAPVSNAPVSNATQVIPVSSNGSGITQSAQLATQKKPSVSAVFVEGDSNDGNDNEAISDNNDDAGSLGTGIVAVPTPVVSIPAKPKIIKKVTKSTTPVAVKPTPTTIKIKSTPTPVVVKPTPIVAKPTPVVVKPTPVVVKPTPVATKPSGTFTGQSVNVSYGNVQVQITVVNGKITGARALQQPQGGRSGSINQQAIPMLNQQALSAQSANIQGVSGASYTSQGYQASLASAISKAGI